MARLICLILLIGCIIIALYVPIRYGIILILIAYMFLAFIISPDTKRKRKYRKPKKKKKSKKKSNGPIIYMVDIPK